MPSLREYTAHFQIDARRLGPRQLLMHPGPVNRGIELSGEVIDSPQSLIAEQVPPASSCGWRCSTRCSPARRRAGRPTVSRPTLEPQTA